MTENNSVAGKSSHDGGSSHFANLKKIQVTRNHIKNDHSRTNDPVIRQIN